MPTTAQYGLIVNAQETLASNVPAVASTNNNVPHTGYSTTTKTLTATGSATQPPLTKVAYFSKALSSGTGTIDLTALPGTNGATADATGLKVCLLVFRNPPTNANKITITKGATNGFGVTSADDPLTVTLSPGAEIAFFGNEVTPDVASGKKTIDLTGTGSQALECVVWAG